MKNLSIWRVKIDKEDRHGNVNKNRINKGRELIAKLKKIGKGTPNILLKKSSHVWS